jgi:hypothetical protein
MNLFRSEEHVRNWNGFKAGTEEGILPLPELVKLFSGPLFTRRLDADYVSSGMYVEQFQKAVAEIGKVRRFWSQG